MEFPGFIWSSSGKTGRFNMVGCHAMGTPVGHESGGAHGSGTPGTSQMAITIKRDVLLVEIDRHCFFPGCNARISIGLTRLEVPEYRGFECTHCKRWNDDQLARRDIPEWWDEFNSSGTFS